MGDVIPFRQPVRQQGFGGNGFVAYAVAVFAGLTLIGAGIVCILGGVLLVWFGLQTLP